MSGDGGSVGESVCTSGLHLVCAGTADLSHSTDTTVKRMSSKRPGILLNYITVAVFSIITSSLDNDANVLYIKALYTWR